MKRRLTSRLRTIDAVERQPRSKAQKSAARKALAEGIGGALLVVAFVAFGLLYSVLLAVGLGALAAGLILIAIGNL